MKTKAFLTFLFTCLAAAVLLVPGEAAARSGGINGESNSPTAGRYCNACHNSPGITPAPRVSLYLYDPSTETNAAPYDPELGFSGRGTLLNEDTSGNSGQPFCVVNPTAPSCVQAVNGGAASPFPPSTAPVNISVSSSAASRKVASFLLLVEGGSADRAPYPTLDAATGSYAMAGMNNSIEGGGVQVGANPAQTGYVRPGRNPRNTRPDNGPWQYQVVADAELSHSGECGRNCPIGDGLVTGTFTGTTVGQYTYIGGSGARPVNADNQVEHFIEWVLPTQAELAGAGITLPFTFTLYAAANSEIADGGTAEDNPAATTMTINLVQANASPTAVIAAPADAGKFLVNTAVSFDATGSSDSDGTIASYDWNFGDGNTSGPLATPTTTHTYTTAGPYNVSLTVTDNLGATSVPATASISVVASPVADAGGPYTGVIPPAGSNVTVAFDAQATTDADTTIGNLTFDWAFDATGVALPGSEPAPATATGTGVAGATPAVQYFQPGTYTVNLTVTDPDTPVTSPSATSTTVTIVQGQAPVANAGGPYSGPAGSPVLFDGSLSSDADGTIVSYDWDVNNDGTFEYIGNAGPTQAHTYATPGTRTVALRVTDNDGFQATATTSAAISGNQAPVASAGVIQYGRTSDSFTFDASGTTDDGPLGELVYEWDYNAADGLAFTDATGVTSAPAATYGAESAAAGLPDGYVVTVRVTDQNGTGLSDVAETRARVSDGSPVAVLTAPDGTNIGTGESHPYDASGSWDVNGATGAADTIANYTFDFGDGAGPQNNGANPVLNYTYANPGTFNATVTVTDNDALSATSAALSITVSGNLAPTAALTGPTAGTVGQSLTYDGAGSTDPDGSVVEYRFSWGDASPTTVVTAPTTQASHSYSDTGTYTVSLTVVDDLGRTSAAPSTLSVTITGNPPTANPGGPYTGEVNVPVTFDGTGSQSNNTGGFINTYEWNFGDGTPIVNNGDILTHTYATNGVFTVTLTVTDEVGTSASANTTATIDLALPRAVATAPASGSVNVSVTFDGTASFDPDGTIAVYAWDFGDGSPIDTTSGAVANHAYTTAGAFSWTLTVTDDDAQSASTTPATITIVAAPPIARITGAPGPITTGVGTSVSFDASGSSDPDGSVVSYSWDFGDSTTGTGVTTSHAYAASGSYSVSLTVTDNDGLSDTTLVTDSAAQRPLVVQVGTPPIANPGGPYSGQVNTAIVFNGTGSSDPDGTLTNASYRWDFGDGTPTSSGATPSHTYTAVGTYTVGLTVTDSDGLTNSASTTADVFGQGPTARPNGPYRGVKGVPLTLDGSASSDPDGTIVAWDWDVDFDGTSFTPDVSGQTASYTYTQGSRRGSFTVRLRVTDNDGLRGFANSEAFISSGKEPVANAGGPYTGVTGAQVCVDGSGSFDPDGSIYQYLWDFGDGKRAQTTRAVTCHTYTAPNPAYTVQLYVRDNDFLLSATVKTTAAVTLASPPTAVISAPATATFGQLVSFDGSGSTDNGSITGYAWNFGDGTTGSGATTTHSYALDGSYTVTLTVTDNDGLTASATHAITVDRGGAPIADAGGPYTGVAQSPVSMSGAASVDSDGGSILAYDWDFGDGNVGAGVSTTHSYALPGTYTVTLTVTDNAALTNAATTTASIATLAPVANPGGPYTGSQGAAIALDGSLSADADGSIVSYMWNFGDGMSATSAVATASHAYVTAGTFTVTLTVTDNNGATGTASTTADVTADPAAPVANANGPYKSLTGALVNFDASASTDDGTIVSYDWDYGDGSTGSGVNSTHAYASQGLYTVRLTVTDDTGLVGRALTTAGAAISNNKPVAVPNGPYTGNVGVAVTFDGSKSFDLNGSIYRHTWDFGDGIKNATGAYQSHAYAAAGTYQVCLLVMDNSFYRSDSTCSTVTIAP